MKAMGQFKRFTMLWALLAALAFVLPPAVAQAQQAPYFTAVVYEVREAINCNPGPSMDVPLDPLCTQSTTPDQGFGTRIADATLVGGVPGAPGAVSGGASGNVAGGIVVEAGSILSQVDWNGPAHGKFQTLGGQSGTFSGQLDLGPIFQNVPLATITGQWAGTKGTLKAGGPLSGVFLIPIPLGCTNVCFYLDLAAPPGSPFPFVPLADDEYFTVGGMRIIGLVKASVNFFNDR